MALYGGVAWYGYAICWGMEQQSTHRPVRLLPDNVANQIAAGEVVERPASVLKELVENAIDAGASRIDVEVGGGGRALIKVVDDGQGMSQDDALMALERHATSKVVDAADLEHVGTLGFRGEAIPSIASVSRLSITTRRAQDDTGYRVVVHGGVIQEAVEVGCRIGTTVEMRDLFYNIPARRKFLKSQTTENSHLATALVRLALGWPEAAFRYTSGGKLLYDLPKVADPMARVAALLGRDTARSMLPLDIDAGPVRLTGLLGLPSISRSAADQVYTFVNGRFVRDRTLLHAVNQAYHGLMPRDRRPVVVLNVEIDPGQVDVNVHPAKVEVRFRRSGEVHDAVAMALRQGLTGRRGGQEPEAAAEAPAAQTQYYDPPLSPQAAPVEHHIPGGAVSEPRIASWRDAANSPAPAESAPLFTPAEPQTPVSSGLARPMFGAADDLSVIGQLHGLYILCSAPDGLVIMDQHAAHERLTFERLKSQAEQGVAPSQGLLAPVTLELSPQEAMWAEKQAPAWANVGLEMNHFGGNTWAITALPAAASGADPAALVRDLLSEMTSSGLPVDRPEFVEAALVSLSCHGSIRQGQKLSMAELEELVRQAAALPPPVTCPHGRPVFLRISRRDLAKAFKRGSEA